MSALRRYLWAVLGCSCVTLVTACLVSASLRADEGQPPAIDETSNPYLAGPGLSTAELVDFIQRMQRKPETIRRRPGFMDAILDACDRVLAAKATEPQEAIALLTKFEILHQHAVRGDGSADDKLNELSKAYEQDQRAAVAEIAHFHRLEQRTADAGEIPAEELPKLIDELRLYFTDRALTEKHLRLASNTVRAINATADAAQRAKLHEEFGKLFAKSADKKLAKYGRSIAQIKDASALVGKPFEIDGTTVAGQPFDWGSYRGKVVLVDFWATWCGPCRAELPNVKKNYEQWHAKGFEVVAISLDSDREALEAFIAEQGITWTNLYDDMANGWENPNAVKHGIKAIPAAILIDKEGKVVTTKARGEELGKQLERLLGTAAAAAEPADGKAAPKRGN